MKTGINEVNRDLPKVIAQLLEMAMTSGAFDSVNELFYDIADRIDIPGPRTAYSLRNPGYREMMGDLYAYLNANVVEEEDA